jgi:hypothetical protein
MAYLTNKIKEDFKMALFGNNLLDRMLGRVKRSSTFQSNRQISEAKAQRVADAKREREQNRRANNASKQIRDNSARDAREASKQQKIDQAQDINLQALENDIKRVEEKRKNNYKAARTAVKNLARQIDRRDDAQDKRIQAVYSAQSREERASARIGNELRAALAEIPGSSDIEGLLAEALKDGRLNMTELTSLAYQSFMFGALGMKTLREEIAANEGDIDQLDGEVQAIEELCTGIDANAQTISGMASTLTDGGFFDSGDFVTNLSNGSVFFNGGRMDAHAFILSMTALKAARVHVEVDREDEDFADWFMTEADAAKVVTGHRLVTTSANEVVRDSDGMAFLCTANGFQQAFATDGNRWPQGAMVEVKAELGLAPDLDAILKVAGTFGIQTFDRWYTTVLPLFSEKLGSFLGLGEGIDFAANVSDDD